MKTILITGANRGIGLEFVKQYLDEGCNVIACCRLLQQADSLHALACNSLKIYPLDVNKSSQIDALATALVATPIDILIHNAGVLSDPEETFGTVDAHNMATVFQTNCIGPMMLSQALLPQLLQGSLKTIVAVTSIMGSMACNELGRYYSYRASKAGLNAIMQSMAIDLAPQGVRVLTVHPGWVKTRMGGEGALISTEESVTGMRAVIADEVRLPAPGFYRYDGQMVPF